MTEEPFFLLNEFLDKEKQELEKVMEIINPHRFQSMEKSVFLRNFTNQLFKAHRKKKTTKPQELKRKREELEKRKQLIHRKLEIQKKLQELHHNIEEAELSEEKSVIISKETKKPLVKTEFNGTEFKVTEPELTEKDKQILNSIKNKDNFLEELKLLVKKFDIEITEEYQDKIRYYLVRNTKYGKVSPLVEDQDIKEIVCSSSDKPLTVAYKDNLDIPTNIKFESDKELNEFILNLAKNNNQEVSEEKPIFNFNIGKINIEGTLGNEFVKPKFIITKI